MSLPFHQVMREARAGSPYPRLTDFAERIGMSASGYKKIETTGRLPPKETLERIIHAGQVGEKKGEELMQSWEAALAARHGITMAGKRADVKSLASKIENEVRLLFKQCRTPVPQVAFQVFSRRLVLILRAVLED